jgi:hypothetical protein
MNEGLGFLSGITDMKPQPLFLGRLLTFIALFVGLLAAAVGQVSAAQPVLGLPGLAKLKHGTAPSLSPIGLLQPVEADFQTELAAFAASVVDGRAHVLRGVYVPGVLALRVVQQPAGAFSVDLTPGVTTQFSAASAYGVTGLLADNIASGALFYSLAPGQPVTLIYGDGRQSRYLVGSVSRFQALRPTDPYSDFVDLATGARLSSSSVFNQMYSGGDKITFQTCLAQDGVMAWGRLFVTAYPAP